MCVCVYVCRREQGREGWGEDDGRILKEAVSTGEKMMEGH
jgi:hypothetical protein